MSAEILIRPETPADREAVATVNRLAFGRDDEANLVAALRAGGYTTLSLVAETGGQIVGHILFGPLVIATSRGQVAAVSLAPMAVIPDYQRQGVGGRLVAAGLELCSSAGHKIVVVLGHPEYYVRFGFSPSLAAALESPFSGIPAWMALELAPQALSGVVGKVIYPPPFGINE